MVYRVLSRYKTGAPKDAFHDGEERIIKHDGPLYPDMLSILDNCSVSPATTRTDDFMAIHMVDLSDLRKFAEIALKSGKYINSQWCKGNSPPAIYACDSYVVSAVIYSPKDRDMTTMVVYIKLCITDTGNTVAVISFHESEKS